MIKVNGIDWSPVDIDEKGTARRRYDDRVVRIKRVPDKHTGTLMAKSVIIPRKVANEGGLRYKDDVRLYSSDGAYMLRKEKSCFSYTLKTNSARDYGAYVITGQEFARTLHRLSQCDEFEAAPLRDAILLIPINKEEGVSK